MAERTENVTLTLDNGKQLLVKPKHSPEDILKGVKALDPEGSYPEYLKRYGYIQARKDKEPTKATAYVDAILQGLTFGYSDEIAAAGDAAFDSLTGKGSYSDLYDRYQSTYQANLDESGELLGDTERVLTEYGVPIVAARQLLSKLGQKGINALATNASKSKLRKEAKDAGFTKEETKIWEQINELPQTEKGFVRKWAERILPVAVTPAAIIGGATTVGSGQADPGDRLGGAVESGVLATSIIDRLNPLSGTFRPGSVVQEIIPGFNQGGQVMSPRTKFYLNSGGKVGNKIKLLMAEGKPQDQAVAIALDYKRRGKL